jgi:hypothetical protein
VGWGSGIGNWGWGSGIGNWTSTVDNWTNVGEPDSGGWRLRNAHNLGDTAISDGDDGKEDSLIQKHLREVLRYLQRKSTRNHFNGI